MSEHKGIAVIPVDGGGPGVQMFGTHRIDFTAEQLAHHIAALSRELAAAIREGK